MLYVAIGAFLVAFSAHRTAQGRPLREWLMPRTPDDELNEDQVADRKYHRFVAIAAFYIGTACLFVAVLTRDFAAP